MQSENVRVGDIALIIGAEYCEENIGRVVEIVESMPCWDESQSVTWGVRAVGSALHRFSAFDRYTGQKEAVNEVCVRDYDLCLISRFSRESE